MCVCYSNPPGKKNPSICIKDQEGFIPSSFRPSMSTSFPPLPLIWSICPIIALQVSSSWEPLLITSKLVQFLLLSSPVLSKSRKQTLTLTVVPEVDSLLSATTQQLSPLLTCFLLSTAGHMMVPQSRAVTQPGCRRPVDPRPIQFHHASNSTQGRQHEAKKNGIGIYKSNLSDLLFILCKVFLVLINASFPSTI